MQDNGYDDILYKPVIVKACDELAPFGTPDGQCYSNVTVPTWSEDDKPSQGVFNLHPLGKGVTLGDALNITCPAKQ